MPDESLGDMLYTAMKKETAKDKRERTRRLAEQSLGLQGIAVEQQTETENMLAEVRTAALQLAEGPDPFVCKRIAHRLLEQAAKVSRVTGFR